MAGKGNIALKYASFGSGRSTRKAQENSRSRSTCECSEQAQSREKGKLDAGSTNGSRNGKAA